MRRRSSVRSDRARSSVGPFTSRANATTRTSSSRRRRLREALASAGWDDVELEYEPVAAAHYYESTLDHDEIVLIADFGGGTSDFSLIRVGPGQRDLGVERVVGNDGVGIAGDVLDSRLMYKLVAPSLGLGTTYKALMGDKELPVPVSIYNRLLRWHHLSFLKTKKNIELLEGIASQTRTTVRFARSSTSSSTICGYELYRAIEKTKVALSSSEDARFTFSDDELEIDLPSRARSSTNGSPRTSRRCRPASTASSRAWGRRADVDQVFLTGGSSLVPAVRRIFESRFGADRIRSGGELISVASGLALRAARDAR